MPNFLPCTLQLILVSVFAATLGCSGSDASIPNPSGSGNASSGSSSGDGQSNGNGNGNGNKPGDSSSPMISTEGAALFETPSNTDATPGFIVGLWGGVIKDLSFTFDTRMRIDVGKVTFATRCDHSGTSGAIAGVTAKARVTDFEFAILESKKDERKLGDITCRANAHVGEVRRCAEPDSFPTQCFVINGTKLTFYGDSPLDKLELTKISD
jgi:hypothetical protein